jgi:DNA-directed RNA polymerase subunit RPC12/RpoP
MDMNERIAYLKGLITGLEIDENSKEGKIFNAIVDTLEEMALTIGDVMEDYEELEELVDILDEDLGSVEQDLYDDKEQADDDFDDFDNELYEYVCPTCGDTVCIDEEMLDEGEMKCPNCGEEIEFDLDCDCDCGDDCGCDDDCGCKG